MANSIIGANSAVENLNIIGRNAKDAKDSKDSKDAKDTKNTTATEKSSATANGTPIVNPGSDLDKNAFFKILAAQLANMDPTQDQDSTAYITQMAQFSALEQMTNLNNTMTLTAAQNLTGKLVALNVYDSKGIPESGIVRAIYTSKGETYVSVEGFDGKYKDYKYSQVTDVIDYGDPNMDNLAFSNATTLIGKKVDVTTIKTGEDGKEEAVVVSGKVTKVYRDSEGIKVKVEIEEDGEIKTKEYFFEQITSVEG